MLPLPAYSSSSALLSSVKVATVKTSFSEVMALSSLADVLSSFYADTDRRFCGGSVFDDDDGRIGPGFFAEVEVLVWIGDASTMKLLSAETVDSHSLVFVAMDAVDVRVCCCSSCSYIS
jgi:hypothetical protein